MANYIDIFRRFIQNVEIDEDDEEDQDILPKIEMAIICKNHYIQWVC